MEVLLRGTDTIAAADNTVGCAHRLPEIDGRHSGSPSEAGAA